MIPPVDLLWDIVGKLSKSQYHILDHFNINGVDQNEYKTVLSENPNQSIHMSNQSKYSFIISILKHTKTENQTTIFYYAENSKNCHCGSPSKIMVSNVSWLSFGNQSKRSCICLHERFLNQLKKFPNQYCVDLTLIVQEKVLRTSES